MSEAIDPVKPELYTDAALSVDLPECGLRRGDIVKLVDELTADDGTPGYAIEVLNALGETHRRTCNPGVRRRTSSRG